MRTILYELRPDVAGELGPRTVWEKPRPERPHGPCGVLHAEYAFYHWYGDCLLTAHPVYLATDPVVSAMKDLGVTGFLTESANISFAAPYSVSGSPAPDEVPRFVRLVVSGRLQADPRRPIVHAWDGQDLSDGNIGLVVTGRTLEILRQHGLSHCVVRPVTFAG